MDPVADAINSLGAILRSLQLTAYAPRFEANTYNTGKSEISGTGTLDVWVPPSGKTWVLKGFVVTAVVYDVFVATEDTLLYFYDDDDDDRLVAPIGAFSATAAPATIISRDVPDLGSGRRGSAPGSKLKIKLDKDIGGGNVTIGWCVWGDEV